MPRQETAEETKERQSRARGWLGRKVADMDVIGPMEEISEIPNGAEFPECHETHRCKIHGGQAGVSGICIRDREGVFCYSCWIAPLSEESKSLVIDENTSLPWYMPASVGYYIKKAIVEKEEARAFIMDNIFGGVGA